MTTYPDSVSIILPNYNHALFLRERIESVLSQARPYDEIIFLDDASTDDSVELAKALLKDAPCNVVYQVNSVNSGSPFCQWNKGFKLASKQWIWIAETDDACHTQFLQRVLGAAIENNSHFAYTQSFYVDEQGVPHFSDFVRMNKFKSDYFNVDFTKPGIELVQHFFSKTNCIPNASAVIFKSSLIQTVGYANEAFYFTGDWEYWIRLLANSRVSFVAEELNYFRFHAATTRAIKRNRKRDAESKTCCVLARYIGTYPAYMGIPTTAVNLSAPQAESNKSTRRALVSWHQVPRLTASYLRYYTFYVETKLFLKLPLRFMAWVKRKANQKTV
ncbi:MAG: glycosyltransferase [Chitinophagaceae bacterium]|nr:glycosyltransferase [Chitinophagaceae bacterium]